MSNSRKKTKIFGNTNSSEKEDKRNNNRMFRRKEHMININIEKELHIAQYLDFIERDISELGYPTNMNEIRNIWSMSKDGKNYWAAAPQKLMRK